jgi:hypothetical protein
VHTRRPTMAMRGHRTGRRASYLNLGFGDFYLQWHQGDANKSIAHERITMPKRGVELGFSKNYTNIKP